MSKKPNEFETDLLTYNMQQVVAKYVLTYSDFKEIMQNICNVGRTCDILLFEEWKMVASDNSVTGICVKTTKEIFASVELSTDKPRVYTIPADIILNTLSCITTPETNISITFGMGSVDNSIRNVYNYTSACIFLKCGEFSSMIPCIDDHTKLYKFIAEPELFDKFISNNYYWLKNQNSDKLVKDVFEAKTLQNLCRYSHSACTLLFTSCTSGNYIEASPAALTYLNNRKLTARRHRATSYNAHSIVIHHETNQKDIVATNFPSKTCINSELLHSVIRKLKPSTKLYVYYIDGYPLQVMVESKKAYVIGYIISPLSKNSQKSQNID